MSLISLTMYTITCFFNVNIGLVQNSLAALKKNKKCLSTSISITRFQSASNWEIQALF